MEISRFATCSCGHSYNNAKLFCPACGKATTEATPDNAPSAGRTLPSGVSTPGSEPYRASIPPGNKPPASRLEKSTAEAVQLADGLGVWSKIIQGFLGTFMGIVLMGSVFFMLTSLTEMNFALAIVIGLLVALPNMVFWAFIAHLVRVLASGLKVVAEYARRDG